MNSLTTSNLLFQQLDNKFRAFLRSHGLSGTRHRQTILKILLDNPKPVSARDIHHQVKTVNPAVSFHCVYHTMTLLVRSGLAKEIIPQDGSARLYTHDIAIAQCGHSRCVCQECGVVIEVMEGQSISTEEEKYAEEIQQSAAISAPNHRRAANRFVLQRTEELWQS